MIPSRDRNPKGQDRNGLGAKHESANSSKTRIVTMTNASELLEGLFREAHEADECNQMMDCDPRTIICAQTELRHFEAQVTQLEAKLKLAGNRLRAAAVNEVAKSGQTREYYEYSEWADEIDALLTKEPK